MLEKANLTRVTLKEDYETDVGPFKARLSMLQHRVKEEKLPVLVLFEGWSAAGKGTILSDIILTLDPRNFKAKSTTPPTADERRKPFLWRHWMSLPERGIFGIFDRSWYPEVVDGAVEQGASKEETKSRLTSINSFERQLSDDGTLIVKIFLHITKKEQKRRLEKLGANKATAWRVNKADFRKNKRYEKYYACYESTLAETDTTHTPWHIVSGQDRLTAQAEIYGILVAAIEEALVKRDAAPKPAPTPEPPAPGPFSLLQMPSLAEVHLGKTLPRGEYKSHLEKLKKRLGKLHNAIYLQKKPVVILYEGWDAAGKGGNIKRLTSALDPRGYEVVPIASPTPTELAHHYLWRFWQGAGKDGHITIFDRSWYGRVLVERVEGFAAPAEWGRAYREINEFEAELAHWGAVVVKFWLQIDKEEQLRRFEARRDVPEKQWKITDEDWQKWDDYEVAVDDMIRLTSTDHAPWTIIESEDKRFGRIKALETVINSIETQL